MTQSNATEITRGKHITALDGVRGMAVLLVVVFHYGGGAQSRQPLVHAMGVLIKFGWAGVSLFFVLSGFLITGILWDARGKPHWWKNFYIRRVLRIFPLYYAALLLTACLGQWHGEIWQNLKGFATYAFYLQNYPTLFQNNIATHLKLYHFWSLAVEEQFYLVWPFVINFIYSRASAKRICVAVIFGSLIFRLIGIHYGFVDVGGLTLSRSGELAAGAWLALTIRGPRIEWEKVVRLAPACAIISALGLVGIGVLDGSFVLGLPWMTSAGLCFLAFLCSSLVVLAISGFRFRRLMETRWLCWFGTISYGLYVYHVLLLGLYQHLAYALVGSRSQSVIALTIAAVGLPCTLFVTVLSFRYLESPMLRLKNRFGSKDRSGFIKPVQHIAG